MLPGLWKCKSYNVSVLMDPITYLTLGLPGSLFVVIFWDNTNVKRIYVAISKDDDKQGVGQHQVKICCENHVRRDIIAPAF